MLQRKDLLDKKKVKNTIYLAGSTTCMFDLWSEVAVGLYEDLNFKPRYFFYWDEKKFCENSAKLSSKFDVYFHNHMDAWKGEGFFQASRRNVLDKSKLDFFAQYELIALKMMDRVDPLGECFPFSHRQYFFRDLLLKWLDIVDELSISMVVSPSIPHQIYDYVLYAVCQYKNIEFITFQHTPFLDASLLIGDIDGLPNIYDYDEALVETSKAHDFIDEYIEKVTGDKKDYKLDYMEAQKKKHTENVVVEFIKKAWLKLFKEKKFTAIPRYVRSLFKHRWSYLVEKGKMPSTSDYSNFELGMLKHRMHSYIKSIEHNYTKICKKFDSDSKYVYVALHYQPEETTSPTGGVYVDQLLIVEMLDRFLPADVNILVKEHPSQFYKALESSQGRTDVFYERLNSFSDRVVIVDYNLNSFDLIDDAICVVTVSGTVGFESILRGKPALTFGRTWYEYVPGVFRVRNYDDLKSAWEFIATNRLSDLLSNARQYLKCLCRDMVFATHCGSYSKRSSTSRADSVENIRIGIQQYLHYLSL